jgi:hypothetical protein
MQTEAHLNEPTVGQFDFPISRIGPLKSGRHGPPMAPGPALAGPFGVALELQLDGAEAV